MDEGGGAITRRLRRPTRVTGPRRWVPCSLQIHSVDALVSYKADVL